jgi:hypothetical protein
MKKKTKDKKEKRSRVRRGIPGQEPKEFFRTDADSTFGPKKGMSRYPFRHVRPEVLHEIRLVHDNLRKSIEDYLTVCEVIRWSKMFPFRKAVKRFYTKYQLHLQGVVITSVDDGVLNGSIDPDTYIETQKGLQKASDWRKFKAGLWK